MKVTLTGSIEVKGKLQRWHPSIKGEKKKNKKEKKGKKRPFLAVASQRVNVQDGACWLEHKYGTCGKRIKK